MDTFGKRLKHYAKTRHGGVGKMAEALSINPTQMSGYCSDAKRPDTEVLERMRFAGVSIDWLFTGDGDPDADPITPESVDNAEQQESPGADTDKYLREIEEIVKRWRNRTS